MPNDALTVLFIGGYGRSGSTLLERILGRLPGFISVGEICHIWERGILENQLCGCKTPFNECKFWSAVLEDAFGSMSQVDFQHIISLKNSVDTNQRLAMLAWPACRSRSFAMKLREYQDLLYKFFNSIKKISNGTTIIDSSKDPSHAFILSQMPELDFRMIHLVRDGRAVAHSWKREKVRPEIYWKQEFMPQFSSTRCGVVWMARNLLTEIISRRIQYAELMRYEDLVSNPRLAVTEILRQLNFSFTDSAFDFIDGNKVHVGLDHTAAGNPMRFQQGQIVVQNDQKWLSEMKSTDKMYLLILESLLLRRYGYI